MAPKQTPTPPPAGAPPADAPEIPGSPLPKELDEWAELPAPVAMANKQGPSSITANVLETVPDVIRQRAEASLAINTERVAKVQGSTAKRKRIDYHWDLQPVKDQAQGERFSQAITKYAKYRPSEGTIPHAATTSPRGQVTARCGNPGYFKQVAEGEYEACAATAEGAIMGIRYSVRPFEQRSDTRKLPGS